ncbi:Uridylate-specific endoribonuclease [Euphorbia peplus]|nr:Uridylate-specific endoribonuclease [Euphorbia peplus]
MEGLIKGLVKVAIDAVEGRVRRGRDEQESRQEQIDENRNKWTPTSSEQHGEGSQHESNSRPSRRSQQHNEEAQEESVWAPSRRPKQEENVEGDDGWETVGKKHPKQRRKLPLDMWNGYKGRPSEQEYSNEVEDSAYLVPSKEELADLSQACNKLWELDTNRLVPGKDYDIDCGEGKKVYQKDDMAQGSLFRWVDDDVLRRPTIARFCSLLDNYNPNEGYKEAVTSEEKQEQSAFIEEISRTAPIKYVHKYLASKGIVSNDYQDFKRILTSLWFDLYGRGGTSSSSSAFEHVFVGEVKQQGEQQVSGFHNWLQFFLEESKGRVDYQGYIFPRRRGQIPESETQLLTVQFEWNGVLKSVSSMLIGVSPEFEVALYTLCFYVGREDNNVEFGPYSVNIKCYRFGDRMGSVFPIATA